jgi:hypothetical protein
MRMNERQRQAHSPIHFTRIWPAHFGPIFLSPICFDHIGSSLYRSSCAVDDDIGERRDLRRARVGGFPVQIPS